MNIILHQYPGIYGLPSLSPFCHKVETYLRMTQLPYSLVTENNPLRGPRNRMPFIELDGIKIPDSHDIINTLEGTGGRLDAFLNPQQKAFAFTLRRSLDEDFIRIIRYSRYVDENGWKVLSKDFRKFFPPLLRDIALPLIRKNQLKQCKGSQLLELSQNEIYKLGIEHLENYERLIAESPYVFGKAPSSADATLYAFLECVIKTPLDVPLRKHVLSRNALLKYCEQISEKYFN